jgi:hypothetical protein
LQAPHFIILPLVANSHSSQIRCLTTEESSAALSSSPLFVVCSLEQVFNCFSFYFDCDVGASLDESAHAVDMIV